LRLFDFAIWKQARPGGKGVLRQSAEIGQKLADLKAFSGTSEAFADQILKPF